MTCCQLGLSLILFLLFQLHYETAMAESSNATTVPWPQGMSFVGLSDQAWQLYVVQEEGHEPAPVDIPSEPRTPVYSPTLNIIAYISTSGDIVKHDIVSGDDTVLLSVEPEVAYTQPFLSPDRRSLIVVELEQAKSKQTRILEIDLESGEIDTISQQRTAQFEPYVRNDILYYTNVLCIENCAGRYVHEIWEKNLISQDARQLTLLNSQTYQPAVATANDVLIVSSEKSGVSRVWRCPLNADPPLACAVINSNSLADTSPVIDRHGRLFLLRQLPDGTQKIVHIPADKPQVILPLPPNITVVRDLEIGL